MFNYARRKYNNYCHSTGVHCSSTTSRFQSGWELIHDCIIIIIIIIVNLLLYIVHSEQECGLGQDLIQSYMFLNER